MTQPSFNPAYGILVSAFLWVFILQSMAPCKNSDWLIDWLIDGLIEWMVNSTPVLVGPPKTKFFMNIWVSYITYKHSIQLRLISLYIKSDN